MSAYTANLTTYGSNLSHYASIYRGELRWHLHQPHLGTQVNRCGCFLPDLTRFTMYCCEGTSGDTIEKVPLTLEANYTHPNSKCNRSTYIFQSLSAVFFNCA